MRILVLVVLIALCILEVVSIFVPVTPLLLIIIFFSRPAWFKQLVLTLYGESD